MNQVQEMPRLNDLARLPEAIERLSGLFERMKLQPGFISAELLQSRSEPLSLLVLHAWRDLADWQTYQTSPEKLAFTASRPEGLYDMVECGMNWRSWQADGASESGILRREVIQRPNVDLRGGDAVGCQTFVNEDDLLAFIGCTLRLTRLSAVGAPDLDPDAIVDELYESLLTVRTTVAQPSAETAAGA